MQVWNMLQLCRIVDINNWNCWYQELWRNVNSACHTTTWQSTNLGEVFWLKCRLRPHHLAVWSDLLCEVSWWLVLFTCCQWWINFGDTFPLICRTTVDSLFCHGIGQAVHSGYMAEVWSGKRCLDVYYSWLLYCFCYVIHIRHCWRKCVESSILTGRVISRLNFGLKAYVLR